MKQLGLATLALLALVGCDKDAGSTGPGTGEPAVARPKAPAPLTWRRDFFGAMAEASSKNRLVFVEFSADWCAPCKEIEDKVFTVDAVRAALGQFVLVKIDLTTESDDERAIADKYDANTLPHLLVLDAGTDTVKGRIGTMTTTDELLAMLSASR